MCDYSLAHYNNRLAETGEQLTLFNFSTGSKGFAPASDVERLTKLRAKQNGPSLFLDLRIKNANDRMCAICIPPGAVLSFSDIPENVQENFRVTDKEQVTFLQMGMQAMTHRDAVRFENGRVVSLQMLPAGMQAKVVSLEGATEREPTSEMLHANIAR